MYGGVWENSAIVQSTPRQSSSCCLAYGGGGGGGRPSVTNTYSSVKRMSFSCADGRSCSSSASSQDSSVVMKRRMLPFSAPFSIIVVVDVTTADLQTGCPRSNECVSYPRSSGFPGTTLGYNNSTEYSVKRHGDGGGWRRAQKETHDNDTHSVRM